MTTSRAIGVLVSGEGTNLQALIDADLPIRAVASNREGVPALARAQRAAIPAAVFALDGHADREARDLAMADWLEDRGVQLVVLAGYMHLLAPSFLERFPDRVVNVHPSLLPSFPGMHPIEEALAAGVETTGVTVHLVDEGVDSGPVLRQEPVPVEPRETLVERIHAVEHRLLPEVVRELRGEPGFPHGPLLLRSRPRPVVGLPPGKARLRPPTAISRGRPDRSRDSRAHLRLRQVRPGRVRAGSTSWAASWWRAAAPPPTWRSTACP